MKTAMRLLAIVLFVTTSLQTYAYDFKTDGIYYNILSESDRTVEVTYETFNGNSYAGNIIIPEKVTYSSKSYTVISIGMSAFNKCPDLTFVTIPNTVTSIGNGAFAFCSSLTSVIIPNSVTSAGSNAFRNCTALTSVTVSSSLTSISDYMFAFCSGLTSVTIPNSVTSIGRTAFYSCTGLTSVTIPNSVTTIAAYAFDVCSGMTSLTIGSSVSSIDECAFSDCIGLKSIYMQCKVPVECFSAGFSGKNFEEAVLYVPTGTLSAYKEVDPWYYFDNIREMDFSGVDRIEADSDGKLKVSISHGTITIDSRHEWVTIYNMQGRIVYTGSSHVIDNIAPGIYILKAGNQTAKVSI